MYVGVATAVAITNRSERTLWRMAASGAVHKINHNGRAKFDLKSLEKYISLPLQVEDYPMITQADQGDPTAQTDLAVVFLAGKKYKQAVYWLQRAIEQNDPEAMSLIGRCHINGEGVEQNEKLGLLWIARAANLGHVISDRQMKSIVFGIGHGREPLETVDSLTRTPRK